MNAFIRQIELLTKYTTINIFNICAHNFCILFLSEIITSWKAQILPSPSRVLRRILLTRSTF